MKIQQKVWRAASVAVLAGLIAGCGVQPTNSMGVKNDESQTSAVVPERHRDVLGLTQQQKDQLKAIFEEQGKELMATLKAGHQKIFRQLSADEVDEAQLASAIDAHKQEVRTALPALVGMFADMRDVLTVEQRAKLVEKMEKKMEKRAERAKLGSGKAQRLTAEQEELFSALGSREGHMAVHQAFIAFLRTGDQDVLQTTILTAIDQMPDSATMAAKLAGLTKEQREKLVAMGERRERRMARQDMQAAGCCQ